MEVCITLSFLSANLQAATGKIKSNLLLKKVTEFWRKIIGEYIGSLKIIREYIGSKPYRYGCITALMQRRWKAEFCNNQFDKIGRSSEIKLHHSSPSSSISDKIIHFSDHKQRYKEDRKYKIGRSSEIKLQHWSLFSLHLIETFRVSGGICKKNETFDDHLFVTLRYTKCSSLISATFSANR